MRNPTVEELQDYSNYELIHELEHDQIKEFIMQQISSASKLIKSYMYYQITMILTGIFFVTRTLVMAFGGNYTPFFYLFCGLFFSFSVLILIHELLHAFAFKLTGAPKVTLGWYLKKFIFYAAADRHVLNRKQFTIVALLPFMVVKLISIAGIILFIDDPAIYCWIMVVCTHSLFCAGDVTMLDYLYRNNHSQVYTFDVQSEKKSYFFREK